MMDVLFQIESIEIFIQVLEDIIDNLYDVGHIMCNKIAPPISINTAKEEIKNLILDTNLNNNKISEQLSSKGYDNDKLVTFLSIFEKKKSDLLYLAIVHHNSDFGETVKTFDWKLKLVCGTSELKTITYPLLQLSLNTVTKDHKPAIRIHELDKDMLLRLIGTLEEFVGDNKLSENEQ